MLELSETLSRGGVVIWIIAGLSVFMLALILWKTWQLLRLGAWSGGSATQRAVTHWGQSEIELARSELRERSSLRAQLALTAMDARLNPQFGSEDAREETTRVAKSLLAEARQGLRALDLIATIAPLLGLLGTVIGMIAAFQALQVAGTRADPATLAGGIWQALLTTAAGMAVAIPASMALTWFETVIERVEGDLEDIASRVFTRGPEQ